MRYLIIDTGEEPIERRSGVRVEAFTSGPRVTDMLDVKALTRDVESAISKLVARDSLQWDGIREFIVVPLEDAYKVFVQHTASVQVTSTGGRP